MISMIEVITITEENAGKEAELIGGRTVIKVEVQPRHKFITVDDKPLPKPKPLAKNPKTPGQKKEVKNPKTPKKLPPVVESKKKKSKSKPKAKSEPKKSEKPKSKKK